jgi:hypothetical protein
MDGTLAAAAGTAGGRYVAAMSEAIERFKKIESAFDARVRAVPAGA